MKPKKKKEYVIPFSGLKLGKHEYDFDLTDSFFQNIEYSELEAGNLKAHVVLNKQTNMLVLDFDIKGTVNVMCDRCMDTFDIPLVAENQLIVKIGSDNFEGGDDIVSISGGESEIDIEHYLYENIILAMPYKRIHPLDKDGKSGCNQEMLEKLNKMLVEEQKEQNDPRWNALKNINLN